MKFPEKFLWGAGTSAYQIEGGAYEDGKGLSIWDTYCRLQGKINAGDTGDTACDHYHRWKSDVALMKQIGINSYRFSICWPRIFPDGTGAVNQTGLDFYSRLVDALCAANIEPVITLYHWDLPMALHERGGWMNRDSAGWFADFTSAVVRTCSDRVKYWMPFNELSAVANCGYGMGVHAPGLRGQAAEQFRVVHNLLLAHGRSAQVIRQESAQPALIGIAHDAKVNLPVSEEPEAIDAIRESMFSHPIRCNTDADEWGCHWSNAWILDPLIRGAYPADELERIGENAPEIRPGDMETIAAPGLDFIGLNYYRGEYLVRRKDGTLEEINPDEPPGMHTAYADWPVRPAGLYWGARLLYERYSLPVIITENGMGNIDWITLDGGVHDPQRIDYIHRHLRAVRRALSEGIPVMGYLYWSLMDNFEWGKGYGSRFGLVYIDYATQQRTIKDSGWWYREVIRNCGETLLP